MRTFGAGRQRGVAGRLIEAHFEFGELRQQQANDRLHKPRNCGMRGAAIEIGLISKLGPTTWLELQPIMSAALLGD